MNTTRKCSFYYTTIQLIWANRIEKCWSHNPGKNNCFSKREIEWKTIHHTWISDDPNCVAALEVVQWLLWSNSAKLYKGIFLLNEGNIKVSAVYKRVKTWLTSKHFGAFSDQPKSQPKFFGWTGFKGYCKPFKKVNPLCLGQSSSYYWSLMAKCFEVNAFISMVLRPQISRVRISVWFGPFWSSFPSFSPRFSASFPLSCVLSSLLLCCLACCGNTCSKCSIHRSEESALPNRVLWWSAHNLEGNHLHHDYFLYLYFRLYGRSAKVYSCF